jgi:hypothetical protein
VFEEFGKKGSGFRGLVKRFFVIFLAVFLLAVAVGLIVFLASLPSSRDKKNMAATSEKEQALLAAIEIALEDTGFVMRDMGTEEVYVPFLSVMVLNASSEPVEDLAIRVYFDCRQSFFCEGYAMIFRIQPGEITDAALKCIEPTAFGTVVKGVPLWMTTEPVSYSVQISRGGVYATPIQGKTVFRIID